MNVCCLFAEPPGSFTSTRYELAMMFGTQKGGEPVQTPPCTKLKCTGTLHRIAPKQVPLWSHSFQIIDTCVPVYFISTSVQRKIFQHYLKRKVFILADCCLQCIPLLLHCSKQGIKAEVWQIQFLSFVTHRHHSTTTLHRISLRFDRHCTCLLNDSQICEKVPINQLFCR